MELVVERQAPLLGPPPVEIVERKGLGHPDSVCDAVADEVGRRLARWSLEKTGGIFHYNVDKALLIGGESRAAFGGGEVRTPIELILAGRVTRALAGERVPAEEIALEAARDWLARNLPELDLARDIRVSCRFRAGSSELVDLYGRGAARAANDTSVGVGAAPLTALERAVLAVERALTGPQGRAARPWAGPDVKVLGLRRGDACDLTVATALIGRHLRDLDHYLEAREALRALATSVAAGELGGAPRSVAVNAADDPRRGALYLTVTGTSAESGDDGEVGRGNRVNGLITPLKPMSLEAAAGKNVARHVGRLYNALAERISSALVAGLPGVESAECALASRIGHPVEDPPLAWVRLRAAAPVGDEEVRGVLQDQLARVDEVLELLLAGALPAC